MEVELDIRKRRTTYEVATREVLGGKCNKMKLWESDFACSPFPSQSSIQPPMVLHISPAPSNAYERRPGIP